jgi:hypothetical protein
MITGNRKISQLDITEDNTVHLRFKGSSSTITARALDVRKDTQGRVTYLLLDRLLHRPEETLYTCEAGPAPHDAFNVDGAFVTELTR